MKIFCLVLLFVFISASAYASSVRVSWSHDGENTDGFRIYLTTGEVVVDDISVNAREAEFDVFECNDYYIIAFNVAQNVESDPSNELRLCPFMINAPFDFKKKSWF